MNEWSGLCLSDRGLHSCCLPAGHESHHRCDCNSAWPYRWPNVPTSEDDHG